MGRATHQARATIDDLDRVDRIAELVDGRIVPLMPTGRRPGKTAFKIAQSLTAHAERTGPGDVNAEGDGSIVPERSPGRASFSPDASSFVGALPENDMRFIVGPPTSSPAGLAAMDKAPADRPWRAVRPDPPAPPDVFVRGERPIGKVELERDGPR